MVRVAASCRALHYILMDPGLIQRDCFVFRDLIACLMTSVIDQVLELKIACLMIKVLSRRSSVWANLNWTTESH